MYGCLVAEQLQSGFARGAGKFMVRVWTAGSGQAEIRFCPGSGKS